MPGQLVFPFGVRPQFSREGFVVAPCNEQAFRFVARWPDWPVKAAALHGPAGCGKSHLAHVWLQAAGEGAVYLPLHEVDAGNLSHAEQRLAELPLGCPVLLEGMDGAPPSHARDRLLMALFEHPSLVLLITGRGAPPEWPVVIGDLRSRFDALLSFAMWAPDEALLSGLVRKHFADRQLQVTDGVVRRIVTHVERDPQSIAAFIARADAAAWSQKRPVTERLVMDVLEREEQDRPG
jgi:chromosomal replication initiation ATPase DnaA